MTTLFIQTRCKTDARYKTLQSSVYKAYLHWCRSTGEMPCSDEDLYKDLDATGIGVELGRFRLMQLLPQDLSVERALRSEKRALAREETMKLNQASRLEKQQVVLKLQRDSHERHQAIKRERAEAAEKARVETSQHAKFIRACDAIGGMNPDTLLRLEGWYESCKGTRLAGMRKTLPNA